MLACPRCSGRLWINRHGRGPRGDPRDPWSRSPSGGGRAP